ncbi:MAG: type III pantothenate kinase, partial [Saprospiraceae bacterium]
MCIDRGNSRTKTGVFDQKGFLIDSSIISNDAVNDLRDLVVKHDVQHLIISTTGKIDWDINDLRLKGKVIELSHETALPIEIIYSTPATLGRDRIAAACGAYALYPNQNCLIVDAGTCITLDLLLKKGVYLGGNIAPGIHMRLIAMHDQTEKLPLVEPGFPELAFGDSTLHALQNGACLGAVMEIEGILNRAKEAYGEVSVVITGGDSALLAKELETPIFVEPELVIHGL